MTAAWRQRPVGGEATTARGRGERRRRRRGCRGKNGAAGGVGVGEVGARREGNRARGGGGVWEEQVSGGERPGRGCHAGERPRRAGRAARAAAASRAAHRRSWASPEVQGIAGGEEIN